VQDKVFFIPQSAAIGGDRQQERDEHTSAYPSLLCLGPCTNDFFLLIESTLAQALSDHLTAAFKLMVALPLVTGNEDRALRKQRIHLLQRKPFRLMEKRPKEQPVCAIAYDKYDIVSLISIEHMNAYLHPIALTAIGVTCPIMVLKANDVIAPIATPCVLVAVLNNSDYMLDCLVIPLTGKAHDNGPDVTKKT